MIILKNIQNQRLNIKSLEFDIPEEDSKDANNNKKDKKAKEIEVKFFDIKELFKNKVFISLTNNGYINRNKYKIPIEIKLPKHLPPSFLYLAVHCF